MKILLFIFLGFVTVVALIFVIRFVFNILLDRAYSKIQNLKTRTKKIYQKKKYIKEEEELKREKIEFPKAHSAAKAELASQKQSGTYEIMHSQNHEWKKKELNDINIVDIVQPVGFWTSMILGQKLTYLVQSAQILNKRGDKGFWASMIEAKEKAAGRQHSRGR
ncbi:MAG: hypothetical protein FJ368_00950 [Pelagibacterales bacterium]|nr:hypothetical protein [Pelagibacterales bacterium]